jgi:hypothetical protein
MLPSVARVRIEVLENKLLVVSEVNLPRGDWQDEALDFYVAFGAPGSPRAIDAHLVPVLDGELEANEAELGMPLTTSLAPRRAPNVHALLGRDTMAGFVVHVTPDAFARATAAGQMAALRIRTALDLLAPDAEGSRDLVARLGASNGTPLTLGRVSIVGKAGAPAIVRAEARLCGPDADPHPLALAIVPRPRGSSPSAQETIAPVLAVRHASDDLCVRFWSP